MFFPKIKTLILSVLLAFACLMPMAVSAQQTLQQIEGNLKAAAEQGAGYGKPQDPRTTAAVLIRVSLQAIGTIFLILMVYAGYLWMTARGNEDNVEKAKKILTASVIGLVIVILSYGITLFVAFMVTGGNRNVIETNPPQEKFNPFD